MGFLSNKKNGSASTANVIDGHLILSLPHASEPIIWRMALDKIGTATFEVKQDNDASTAKLILKPKKGTAEIIAPFDSKEDAVDALMAASNALQNAPTQNQSTPSKSVSNKKQAQVKTVAVETPPPPNKEGNAQNWIIALLGAVIAIGLYMYLNTLIPDTNTEFSSSTSSATSTSAPQQSTGVPIPADDYLGGL